PPVDSGWKNRLHSQNGLIHWLPNWPSARRDTKRPTKRSKSSSGCTGCSPEKLGAQWGQVVHAHSRRGSILFGAGAQVDIANLSAAVEERRDEPIVACATCPVRYRWGSPRAPDCERTCPLDSLQTFLARHEMSAFPIKKQTFGDANRMSAKGQKR